MERHGAEGRGQRLLIPGGARHGVSEPRGRLWGRSRSRSSAVDVLRRHDAVVGLQDRSNLSLQHLLLSLQRLLVHK